MSLRHDGMFPDVRVPALTRSAQRSSRTEAPRQFRRQTKEGKAGRALSIF